MLLDRFAAVQSLPFAPSGCGPVSASDLATALPTSAAASPDAARYSATSDEQQARCAVPSPGFPFQIMRAKMHTSSFLTGLYPAKARLLQQLTPCSDHQVAAAMALEVRHRIHRGFEVKPSANFGPQQQQQQRQQQQQPQQQQPLSQEATAQPSAAAPRPREESSRLLPAPLSAKAAFSPAPREREPDGFHDWRPHGYSVSRPKDSSNSGAAASAPAGRGTWLPDSERSDVGVRGFVSMCSAARSIAAVDSPTVLRQHRVEVCSWSLLEKNCVSMAPPWLLQVVAQRPTVCLV